jgi:lipoprotein-releasing system ATP-binding protein
MILFELKNINCKYPGTLKEVLTIENLSVKKGKLTFVVGESGVGKSTLLETLGMMNNTLSGSHSNDKSFNFYPLNKDSAINLFPYWNNDNETLLNELRNNYFSFVFQNNNLMDSFSALENVMLSSLIQGKSKEQAEAIALDALAKFDITDLAHTSTKKLSGGQKQRFAFARAFAKDYVVLFGDEPTGNLDPVNADNLLVQLKSVINDSASGKGAVVVSHDIERTLRFADEIIVISSINDKGHKKGFINKENVYSTSNKQWVNPKGAVYDNDKMMKLLITAMTKKE